MTGQRRPEPGETCRCGRPAVVVYLTGHGEVPWCGIADGGQVQDPEIRNRTSDLEAER